MNLWGPLRASRHAMWAGAVVQSLKLSAWKIGDRGSEPRSDLQVSKSKMFLPRALVIIQDCGKPP